MRKSSGEVSSRIANKAAEPRPLPLYKWLCSMFLQFSDTMTARRCEAMESCLIGDVCSVHELPRALSSCFKCSGLFQMTGVLFWLCVFYCALTGTGARYCAANIVGLSTHHQAPYCTPIPEEGWLDYYFDEDIVDAATREGKRAGLHKARLQLRKERVITMSNLTVKHFTPEYHQHQLSTPNRGFAEYFKKSTRQLYESLETGKALAHKFHLDPAMAGDMLTLLQIPVDSDLCTPQPECPEDDSFYRTFDGSCNNKNNPTWGMAQTPYTRILPSEFDDGIYSKRKSVDGSALPSERTVSVMLIRDYDLPDDMITVMAMSWGQLIAHEVLGSVKSVCYDGLGCMCCTSDGKHLPPHLLSRNCDVVDISPNDYKYGPHGVRCSSIMRENMTFSLNCQMSAGENVNFATSYIDASVVYGPSEARSRRMRQMKDGLMNVSMSGHREMLPKAADAFETCDIKKSETCYTAGDPRVNQNPLLAVLHTVLLRCHNDIARRLKKLQPCSDDEKLYQETRRIVSALIQHITYNELIPVYLGNDESVVQLFSPLESGYFKLYDDQLNPATINSYAGAVYKALHGIIQGYMSLVDEDRCPAESFPLKHFFNRPEVIAKPPSNFAKIARGMVTQAAQGADEFMTTQVTDNMFKRNPYWGQDLAALDIARGRERGLPSYNSFRQVCGLRRACSFYDLYDHIDPQMVRKMETVYKHVEDIDLYVGGIMEKPKPGSVFGPTFHCIVKEQFYRLKYGDRLFYESPSSGFTLEQLDSLRKMTMSRLMCDYGDDITRIQPRCLQKISSWNPLVDCSQIPELDLTPWQWCPEDEDTDEDGEWKVDEGEEPDEDEEGDDEDEEEEEESDEDTDKDEGKVDEGKKPDEEEKQKEGDEEGEDERVDVDKNPDEDTEEEKPDETEAGDGGGETERIP